MVNCILWDLGNEVWTEDASDASITHSNVRGGWGELNINEDPLLASDGMHLQAGSPCIDAGSPDGEYAGQTDIDGEPRVVSDRVDMGADEFRDSEGDGLPDWWERRHFGSPTTAEPGADPDGDGRDNLTEYARAADPLQSPRTYYVNENEGRDGWDGLAAERDGVHGPKATIQAGVDVADPYEGDLIIVAVGTYTGVGNRDLDLLGKVVTLQSSDPDDPDVVAETVIDCEGAEVDEHRAFQFHSNEGADAVVAGFTILGGHASQGGAIYCRASSPTVTNCTFRGNKAEQGGAIYNREHGDLILTKCMFDENTAAKGGGVYNDELSGPTLAECAFRGNVASNTLYGDGGGMYNYGADPTLMKCTFSGNSASHNGGGMKTVGGAPILKNCAFIRNSAGEDGGGMHNIELSSFVAAAPDAGKLHIQWQFGSPRRWSQQ